MLERVFLLRKTLASFLREKGEDYPQFEDEGWLCDLAFLVDITQHLNKLNIQLQGKNILVPDMLARVKAFECKLLLWENQFRQKKCAHFSRLAAFNLSTAAYGQYAAALAGLREEFQQRFKDVRACENELLVFSAPFTIDIADVPEELKMELIELQCDDSLRSKFSITTPVDFWRGVSTTSMFPALVQQALRITSLFGSTYSCEQLFSKMKLTKSKTRARLTNQHLEDVLLLASSCVTPNFEKLSNGKQHQPSH